MNLVERTDRVAELLERRRTHHEVERLVGNGIADAFVLEGQDSFDVTHDAWLSWPEIHATMDLEQRHLAVLVADIESGAAVSPLSDVDRIGLDRERGSDASWPTMFVIELTYKASLAEIDANM